MTPKIFMSVMDSVERAQATYQAPRNPADILGVRGVGRVADEPRALLVLLTERPTDDEMRSVHDHLKGWRLDEGWLDERCSTFIRMECQELPDEVRGAVKTYLGVFCEFLKVRPVTEPMPLVHASTTA